jgi:sulfatase maturation enzyme AslB (radical SAM superfamily)
MISGIRHEACGACWRVEDVEGKSYRQVANETYEIDHETINQILPEASFQFIDLRFGNICNLACRMCSPSSSRKLIPEYQKHLGLSFHLPHGNYEWFESEDFWEELFKYSSNLKKIHLAGGEPLLIKQCWTFLRRLIGSGTAKNLILSYNTNLTLIPPEAKEVWPHFKEVHIFCSMDGVGKINEFIRHPLDWKSFEANMKEIDINCKHYNVSYLEVHATVQVYNVMRITELCDYVANHFVNGSRVPKFDIVYNPEEFDPQVLPAPYREEAARLIDEYIEKIQNGHNQLDNVSIDVLIQNISSIANHLRSGDKNHLFHRFKRLNDLFDQHRNQRTFDFIPELKKAY